MKSAAFAVLFLVSVAAPLAAGDTAISLSWPARPDPKTDTDWIVSVKIQEKWEEQATRQLTLAKTGSSYEVWTKRLMKSPGSRATLTAQENQFSSTSCSALRAIGDAFDRIRISPLPQNFMALHPMVYTFWIATRYGEPRQLEFLVPNGSYWGDLGENPPTLVAWANEAQQLVATCKK